MSIQSVGTHQNAISIATNVIARAELIAERAGETLHPALIAEFQRHSASGDGFTTARGKTCAPATSKRLQVSDEDVAIFKWCMKRAWNM